MAEEFRVLRPHEFHSQLVSKGQRVDGRGLKEVRNVKLEIDAIRTADSSALVKLGNTSLVCGCTKQILKVKEKREDNEEIKIKVELPPICSSPTAIRNQTTAQLLTSTLKNIIDDSNFLNRNKFQIDDSDSYYSVDIEVICLNYDGCVLDAALIAILAALKSLKLFDSIDGHQFMQFKSLPICSTFASIGDHVICDPNSEEETVSSSTWSITIDSTTNRCCHLHKIGGKALSETELYECIQLAKQRAFNLKQDIETINDDTRMDYS